VLIVKNEKQQLETTLPLLSFCDEIVVVDSGSGDGTADFARQSGCRVIQQPFLGYGAQKAFAVDQARNDWVLNIDADEKVTPDLAREIQEFVKRAGVDDAGLEIPRRLVFMGTEFRFGKESRDRVLRLFRKSCGNFDQAAVHEKVRLVRGRVHRAGAPLLHESYPSLDAYVSKMNRYTSLGAEELLRTHPRRAALLYAAAFPVKFVQFLIQHGNLLNGRAGWCWSVLSAHAFFVKHLKLHELKSRSRVAKLEK
jgi:glycosyltransferase involved in cell wall biosynthesis